jgi:hypothetical protein
LGRRGIRNTDWNWRLRRHGVQIENMNYNKEIKDKRKEHMKY